MKIVINIDKPETEDFEKALKLFKSLKYPIHHKGKIEDFSEVLYDVELLANYEELSNYIKIVKKEEKNG